jgi:ankyrin repeat protein
MKSLKIALAAVTLCAAWAPAMAQYGNDGAQFVAAVRKKDGDAAKKLIDTHGTSIINSRDFDGDTALLAAITNHNEDWTAFLLTNGADPNLPGKGGETPLIAAARVGYEDAVWWLLEQGAKVDATNKMGETALIIAVHQRQARILRILLQAGADPDKTDNAAGLSARDYAARDTRSRELLQYIEAKKPKPGNSAGPSR